MCFQFNGFKPMITGRMISNHKILFCTEGRFNLCFEFFYFHCGISFCSSSSEESNQ